MVEPDCGRDAIAAQRAEQVRPASGRMPRPEISSRSITVSLGVAEVQAWQYAGDHPSPCHRPLLMAKAEGRDAVVQLRLPARVGRQRQGAGLPLGPAWPAGPSD